MFIIFGWGHQKIQEFGNITRHDCTNCGNSAPWYLYNVSLWFTLFFLPVIKYSEKHFIACPVCNKSIQLNKTHFDYFKNFTLLNNALKEETISQEDYSDLIANLQDVGSDIALDNDKWDFDEEILSATEKSNTGMTVATFAKIVLFIVVIAFILYIV